MESDFTVLRSNPVIHDSAALLQQYQYTRQLTEQLAAPLSEADAQIQSMPDASPAKWHLAHTTWFFETFILVKYLAGYTRLCEAYNYLFNSYYNGIGEQYQRTQRGVISRPSLAEVMTYRHHVDAAIIRLLSETDDLHDISSLITLGVNHEQQHQELLLTDLKHGLSLNPLFPEYRPSRGAIHLAAEANEPTHTTSFSEGLYTIGHDGNGFAFDNECPQHPVFLQAFELSNRPVSNRQYLAFIEAGGYQNPQYWLSDGWAWVNQQQASAPLYWQQQDGQWWYYTLAGLEPVDMDAPVTHVNYYEATAYAHWAGGRLPTEFEWEVAAQQARLNDDTNGHLLSLDCLRPLPVAGTGLVQLLGDVWEWTSSSYCAYPGFAPFEGNAGEYNGKFMSNQYVLRGGSCATPQGHIRHTYRNFFYAHQAWQFTGIRLAYS